MLVLPAEHPERLALSDEVHARPPVELDTPSRLTYLALLVADDARGEEAARVAELCALFGAQPPQADVRHVSIPFADMRFTWERHGEFSGFMVSRPGLGAEPAAALLPPGWLARLPGRTLVAVHADLLPCPEGGATAEVVAALFGPVPVVGSDVGEGAGIALTDFRVGADGYSRMVLFDRALTPRESGRSLQRLLEIEAYRMLALLALPIARRQSEALSVIEAELATLTNRFVGGAVEDEALLHDVMALAARIESELASSRFRLAACRAYAELVAMRIAELRERRLPGLQTIGEFMDRRFRPAVATCATVWQRLHDLSERIARASTLLSTRVDIARERQNQALLASMDLRAKSQLRLQQTVETLSVAAIVYYAAGLVGYVAKGLKSRGVAIDTDLAVALSLPLLAVLILLALKRARRRGA